MIVEIIDEDPKAALRKSLFAKKAKLPVKEEPPAAKETAPDEKIITVDQISDLSGLILPKGATFKIEELKLHGRINAFEGVRGSALPTEFAEIWKKEFSTAGFKDLDMEEEMATEKAKLKPAPKKFGLATLFNAIHAEEVTYDPKTHGPLVESCVQCRSPASRRWRCTRSTSRMPMSGSSTITPPMSIPTRSSSRS